MFKKRWLRRERIRAVHDSDLERFLSSIGILDQIKNGYYHCVVCGAQITMESLGALYPEDDTVKCVCDHLSCLAETDFAQEDAK